MPDRIAEMAGYRDELSRYERAGRDDRAAAVREQLAAVVKDITVEAEKLDAAADNHMTEGRDLLAARASIEARRLRAALAELGEPETAADATPRQTAVPRKRGSNG